MQLTPPTDDTITYRPNFDDIESGDIIERLRDNLITDDDNQFPCVLDDMLYQTRQAIADDLGESAYERIRTKLDLLEAIVAAQ